MSATTSQSPKPPADPPSAEFDRYAADYAELHAGNIAVSGEAPAFFAEYKIREAARRLAGESVTSIVDFGAGVGASIPYFAKYFPTARLRCIDVSAESLAHARSDHGDLADYTTYNGARLPLEDKTADFVFAACVFHHIPPTEHATALHEILRVLRPGGHFMLFEHNPLNPLTRHAVNTCPFDENAILIRAPHMAKRLKTAGFIDIKTAFTAFFPGALAALRPSEKHLTWLPLGAQYYLWARK